MKKTIILLLLIVSISSCASRDASADLVRDAFPNAKYIQDHKQKDYEFYVIDSSGDVYIVQCQNMNDDKINKIRKIYTNPQK